MIISNEVFLVLAEGRLVAALLEANLDETQRLLFLSPSMQVSLWHKTSQWVSKGGALQLFGDIRVYLEKVLL